jgi:Fe-S-cluster containining protein
MVHQNNYPYHFNSSACKTCNGKCCRGAQGYIWISSDELKKMADNKEMDVAQFGRQYIRLVQGRISLQERVINGEHFCCFFDRFDCRCMIYESRPKQCREFPFWQKLKNDPQKLVAACPGVALKRAGNVGR